MEKQLLEGERISAPEARLAQLVERKALNLVVVGSSPTVGASSFFSVIMFKHTEKSRKRSWADLNRHRWIQSPEC